MHRADKRDDFAEAAGQYGLLDLGFVPALVCPRDPELPSPRAHAIPSLNQHRQALHGINSPHEQRRFILACAITLPDAALRHIDPIRNDLDGHAETKRREISRLVLRCRVVAARLLEIAALIKTPRQTFFPALVRHRPGLEHAARAHNSRNGASRRQGS